MNGLIVIMFSGVFSIVLTYLLLKHVEEEIEND